MKVYEVIKKKAADKKCTTKAMAAHLHIDYELMRRSLKGERKIDAVELVGLCELLNLKLEDFADCCPDERQSSAA